MPKQISEEVWGEIRKEYVQKECKINDLSALFGVSVRSIKQKAKDENWSALRKATGLATKAKALIAVDDIPGRVPMGRSADSPSLHEVLNKAIGLLAVEAETIPGKSKEGCYNAMTNMVKAHRELFPPDAEGLAKIAADLGIRPADFIRALQKEWSDRDAQVG
jgi:hypothetical protein